MTGDSDNELGNAGDTPVPADAPHSDGGPSFRPLRGWASAYQPEPSIWSKIGKLFARKKREEPMESADTPAQELEFIRDAGGDEATADPSLALGMTEGTADPSLALGMTEDADRSPALGLTEGTEDPSLAFGMTDDGTADPSPALGMTDASPGMTGGGHSYEEPSEEYHDAFDAAFDAPRSTFELPPLESAVETPTIAPPAFSPSAYTPPSRPDDLSRTLADPAFFVPDDTDVGPAPETGAETEPALPPIVRDYQLRTGDAAPDMPVVRDYQLHSVDDETAAEPEEQASYGEPQFIPARSLLDDEPEEKKPGFLARLFGFGRKKRTPAAEEFVDEAAASEAAPIVAEEPMFVDEPIVVDEPMVEETVDDVALEHEDIQAEPVAQTEAERLDRPSLEFFMRVDRATDSTETVPTLDDALPMDVVDDAEAREAFIESPADDAGEAVAAETNPYTEEPTEPWIPAVPEPEQKKPGFFARLFGRRKKSDEVRIEPAELDYDSAEPAPTSRTEGDDEAVFAAFDDEPQSGSLDDAQSFATVDDALPLDEPTPAVRDWSSFAPPAPTASSAPPEPQPAQPETQSGEDPFFFDAPAPPASFDQPFSTLEMDAPPPPAPVDGGRSTLEMEEVSEPGPVFDGNMVDLDVTMQEPVAEDDSRSTVQVAPVPDEETTGEMVPPTPPEVTAAMEAERPPFFVPKFRAFYNEIVSHKHQKAEFTAGFATAVMDYTADLSPDAAAQQLQKRLSEILELQAAEATWMGGEAAARYPDAQYAMAALADELFAHIDWAGKEAWPRYQVEQRLFRSNAKDVEFFRRVDKLLKNEAEKPSAAAKDLARMYLLVLAAGFQGKYRPFGLTRPLAEYRRRLYEFVSGKDPLMIYAEERKLFPDASERVVVGRAVSRFSMLQQWAAVLVILLIGYAVISQMAWNRVSADLKDVTARVEAANSTATSDGIAGDPR